MVVLKPIHIALLDIAGQGIIYALIQWRELEEVQ
jgi:hypothetical protein